MFQFIFKPNHHMLPDVTLRNCVTNIFLNQEKKSFVQLNVQAGILKTGSLNYSFVAVSFKT